jgi:DNA-binding Lrp family transcriptional regulator
MQYPGPPPYLDVHIAAQYHDITASGAGANVLSIHTPMMELSMDDLDIAICKALMKDPRMPYRLLGRTVGLSSVAAHKRVQELMASGIINGFRAEIDIRAVHGASIMVFGHSEISSPKQLIQALGADDSTSMVLVGSGNFVFVGAMLRSLTDLERYLEFVKREGKMPQAVAGIHTMRPSGVRMTDIQDPGDITPLEMRIIASLRNDARKRAAEVAAELGVSARMVSSKLDSMMRDSKINLIARWRPDYSNDTVAMLCIAMEPGVDRQAAISLLYRKYADSVVFLSSFSNLPDLIISTVWTRSPKGITALVDEMMAEDAFSSVVPHTICEGSFFETWKEMLLDNVQLNQC